MSDRELLELAAKAAGIHVPTKKDYPWAYIDESGIFRDISCAGDGTRMSRWNPLADDGDALRLMVRLRLHARQFPIVDDGFDAPLGMVEVWRVDDVDPMHVEFLRSGDDRLVVTRRAITRAAAEIGRQMP